VVIVAVGLVAAAVVAVRGRPVRRAAILDQLSLTAPNAAFVDRARHLLEDAGYAVDYFPGETVRVRLIKDLPDRGYEFILLRVHSARIEAADTKTDDVALFTGEMIDLGHYTVSGVPPAAATAVAQALQRRTAASTGSPEPTHTPAETANLIPVFYDPASGELPYFGVRPSYIEQNLAGRFPDSTVVLMGCDGLRSTRLAAAFLARGARNFVSWDRPVTAGHTDRATEFLLQRLLVDHVDARSAVEQTNSAIGPDPVYGGHLVELSR
jgi:hypothetical protein